MKRETLYHTKYFRTDIWNVIRWCVQLSNKHVIIFARNELIHHWLDGEDVSIVWKISLSNKTQSFESWLHFKFRKINSKYIRLHTMKRFLGNQIWRSRTIGARMTHNVSVVHHHLKIVILTTLCYPICRHLATVSQLGENVMTPCFNFVHVIHWEMWIYKSSGCYNLNICNIPRGKDISSSAKLDNWQV